MLTDVKLPFPEKIESHELHSFYASFLVRLFVIQRTSGHHIKITKKEFYKALRVQGFKKARITNTWAKIKPGAFFNYVCEDYIILRGKEAISNDKGFITYIGVDDLEISYYKFCQFVSETYMLRPVCQTDDFKSNFKFKRKATGYNKQIFKRSLGSKRGRGQRKIAEQSGCSLKTVNKRAKRSEKVKVLKRYDALNGYRIRKTNLYFNLESKVYLSYNKSITGKMRLLSLNPDHSSLITNKALFLNESISLNNATDDIYQIVI